MGYNQTLYPMKEVRPKEATLSPVESPLGFLPKTFKSPVEQAVLNLPKQCHNFPNVPEVINKFLKSVPAKATIIYGDSDSVFLSFDSHDDRLSVQNYITGLPNGTFDIECKSIYHSQRPKELMNDSDQNTERFEV